MDYRQVIESNINKSLFDKFSSDDIFLFVSGKDVIRECTKTSFYKLLLKNPVDPEDEELNVLYFTCSEIKNENEIRLSCKSVECDDEENNVVVIDEFEIILTHTMIRITIQFDPLKHASYIRHSVKECFHRLIDCVV
jgi:hypothetical protein